jgi:putative transport protein
MIQILIENPILLLAIVAAIGYPLGQIKIKGSSLGVAAVLFVGLAIGSLDPNLKLPEFIGLLGLVVFIYTIGLSSGAGFFASFRRKGLRDNLFVFFVLLLAGGVAVAVHYLLRLTPALTAGLFAGSLTNTPALAGVLEHIKTYNLPEVAEQLLDQPVVGYSIAYPIGVVGVIMTIFITQKWWRVDYQQEALALRDLGATSKQLQNRTICITRPEATHQTIQQLQQQHNWDVIFGRMKHDQDQLALTGPQTRLTIGDLISVIGSPEDLDEVTTHLGESCDDHLELDRTEYDFRRVFVSNPKVAGHRLHDFNLLQQYGAIVTRVRRGDVELLPHGDTVLELGDRVRVVAKAENMAAVSNFFGDSYRALSEIDLLNFSLGLAMGLLLGLIPIPLPGGLTFELGLAGGPLIVALILGKLGRTGPIVWVLPYSANLVLRQLGLVLFFAGLGTRSGFAFVNTLTGSGGAAIFFGGAIITCVTALLTLWLGYKLLHIPMSLLTGMLAGLQTQPAVLSYALDQSENDLPNIGYATVFPVATITKILLAQLLVILLP